MTDGVEIQITCGDPDEADRIATALVESRMAACVRQLPVRSVYRWEGRIERDDEILLLVTTCRQRVDRVVAAVIELHSYDVPAITVVDIVGGSADYLAWVTESTS